MKHSVEKKTFAGIRATVGVLMLISVFSFTFVSCDDLLGDLTDGDGNDNNDGNGDPVTTPDDFEPNDERSEAFPITLGMEYNAEISENVDDDWFKISPAHGSDTYDKVRISVAGLSQTLKIRVTLYSSSGEELDSEYASTGGQDLTYTFATPGVDYYVRFSGDIGYGVDHSSTGSYSFTVVNLDANDEYAPNHTFATAKASVEFGTAYNGVLVSKHEDDFYRYTNPLPGTWSSYTISLSNVSSSLYGSIARYAADQANLGRTYSNTGGADVSYTLITAEEHFYVRISGDTGYSIDHSSRGSYTLTVVNNGNDDNEPDDTLEQAREITTFPRTLSGTVLINAANNNGGDYEWFKVNVDTGKKISWSVDPDATNTELHFNVYDSNGDYLGMKDGDDGQTIGESMNNNTAGDSFFYIELGAYVGDSGDYTIDFTETTADPN